MPDDAIARLNAALEGRYRIDREVGEGGMAVVYRAEDLRHGRTVAIKVLKPELAAAVGAERFLAEIRTTANLQHPHIMPLFDSGEADGELFYVMPFVEGESLRQRLDREGELPVDVAVRILAEVVDALAYAHDRGVVHRDIKPGNIMLAGRHAMVTDFGVAKALDESATRGTVTTTGMAIGTPRYMAPEQASADPKVDHRADLYATGVVAYELLTGTPPFRGGTARDVLVARLTEKPDPLRTRRESVPEPLDAAVLRCLEERPSDRWQSAEELLAVLELSVTPSGGTTPVGRVSVGRRPAAPVVMVVGAALVLLLVLASVGWWLTRGDAPAGGAAGPALSIGATQRLTADPGLEIFPAISPDGRSVVYAAGTPTRMRLYLRPVAGGRTLALTDDSLAVQYQPRWSPDGARILFLSEGDAKVVSHLGGAAEVVARGRDGAPVEAAAWSPDGREVAIVRDGVLSAVRLDDGTERVLLQDAAALRLCHWSPAGPLACVYGNAGYGAPDITFGNLAPSAIVTIHPGDGAVRELAAADAMNQSPVWILGGRALVYVSDRDGSRDVFVQRFTADLRPDGPAERLTTGSGAHSVSATADGSRLAWSVYQATANIWRLPVSDAGPVGVETATQLTFGPQVIEALRVSPDGRWLLYDSDIAGTPDAWRIPVGGGTPERLTSSPLAEFAPDLSPDGARIAYHAFQDGSREVLVKELATGEVTRVTHDPDGHASYPRWSPDGRALAYLDQAPNAVHLMRQGPDGGWTGPEVLIPGRADGFDWSPDGQRLATRLADALVVVDVATGDMREVVPAAPGQLGEVVWVDGGRAIRFKRVDDEGRATLWEVPAAGGEPRLLARLDDPGRPSLRPDMAADDDALYIALQNRESDVWVAEAESAVQDRDGG